MENVPVYHASIIPLIAIYPISHMGHAKDLGCALSKLPGRKYVGISSNSDVFSGLERRDIINKQWNQEGVVFYVVDSAGKTIVNAFNNMPTDGKRILHILVGKDRESFALRLKSCLERGKIIEMQDNKFDDIILHFPEDLVRSHGLSGTALRIAADSGDEEQFIKHLGPMFTAKRTKKIMMRIKESIQSGRTIIKRR